MADNSKSSDSLATDKSSSSEASRDTDRSQSMNSTLNSSKKQVGKKLVVKSRYMQTKDKSPAAAANQSLLNATLNSTISGRPMAAPTPMKKKPMPMKKKVKKASSPIRDNTLNMSLFPADLSVIDAVAPTPRHAKHPLTTHQEELSPSSGSASGSAHGSSTDTGKPAPPGDRQLSRAEQERVREELQLDMWELQQAIWINQMLQSALNTMEQQAMEQIKALYALVQQKRDQLTSMQKTADTIKQTATVKQLDEWYIETYTPTVTEMTRLCGVAKNIYENLTMTERNIQTTDVYDPQDAQYYDSLVLAAEEMCREFTATHSAVREQLLVMTDIGADAKLLDNTLLQLKHLLARYISLKKESEALALEELALTADAKLAVN